MATILPGTEGIESCIFEQECRGRSPLPGCGAAHLGDATAGPHFTPFWGGVGKRT